MSSAYLFYGKLGSGKGTQSKLLEEYLQLHDKKSLYVGTGKLFRDFVENNNSHTSKKVTDILKHGLLGPLFFPVYLWSQQLIEKFTGNEDLIFDGGARRIEEVPILLAALEFYNITKIHVIVLNASDEEVLQRIHNRHEGRVDDTDMETIHHRLDWYTSNVIPAINIYRNTEGVIVHDIDGMGNVDEIFERIKKAIS
jgi:adenylate kinase family enzyme